MSDNKLWKELLSPAALKTGWNLARNDAKNGFLNVPYYTDVFTISFDKNIEEIVKRLATGTYRPAPITFVDVPKSSLAIRPGSVPEIEDRIVLQSIVRLLAPKADEKLPEAVYSYRLKAKPTSESLFKEADVLDIPYLKSKTITKYFDPFDPWYAAWPEFDEESKATFLNDGYGFLVVTDIAAYFENIQLPLLRDTLLSIFPDEQKIINLIMMFLENWCPATDQQRNFHRGIPQGTQISSFLGNLYLLPLDKALEIFCKSHPARYFRYMDDVRLFTKHYADARKALLLIDQTIRSLHLNTQSAKTEILSEHPAKEITAKLIDTRLDEVNFVIEKTQEKIKAGKLDAKDYKILEAKLYDIAKKQPSAASEAKLIGGHRMLRGLTFRTFRRWLTAHSILGGTYYVRYLVREMQRNPDYRLTRKLVSIARGSPTFSGYGLGSALVKFLKSELNMLPHQHAEVLWAVRYLSKIPTSIVDDCMSLVLDEHAYYYVRSAAAMLLTRVVLEKKFLDECRKAFVNADDMNVRIGLGMLLMQSTGGFAPPTLHDLVFHPNDRIRKFGKLLREVRYDVGEAKKRLKFLFSSQSDWILCDNMALLFSMSLSDRVEVLQELIAYASDAGKKSPRIGLRPTLLEISKRATAQLSNVIKPKPAPKPLLKLVG